jgi:hypothetical protein
MTAMWTSAENPQKVSNTLEYGSGDKGNNRGKFLPHSYKKNAQGKPH